jgi:hypothetical protein
MGSVNPRRVAEPISEPTFHATYLSCTRGPLPERERAGHRIEKIAKKTKNAETRVEVAIPVAFGALSILALISRL